MSWSSVTQAYCSALSGHLREDEGRGRETGVSLRTDVRGGGDAQDGWVFIISSRSVAGKISKRVMDCAKWQSDEALGALQISRPIPGEYRTQATSLWVTELEPINYE